MTEIIKQKTHKEIGAMIRKYRQSLKLSMADLGVKVLGDSSKDRANSYMQRIELGQRTSLKEKDLLKIIEALGLTPEGFLAIELDKKPADEPAKVNPLLAIHPDMETHLNALEGIQKINNPAMEIMALESIKNLINDAIEDLKTQA